MDVDAWVCVLGNGKQSEVDHCHSLFWVSHIGPASDAWWSGRKIVVPLCRLARVVTGIRLVGKQVLCFQRVVKWPPIHIRQISQWSRLLTPKVSSLISLFAWYVLAVILLPFAVRDSSKTEHHRWVIVGHTGTRRMEKGPCGDLWRSGVRYSC